MENPALKWKFHHSYSHNSAAHCPILFSFSHRQPNQSRCSLFKVLTFQNSLCCYLWAVKCRIQYPMCLSMRKCYFLLTSRASELALGCREPKKIEGMLSSGACMLFLGQCMYLCWITLHQLKASAVQASTEISSWSYCMCRVKQYCIFLGTVNMFLKSLRSEVRISRG